MKNITAFFHILCGSVILSIIGLYNGYPLVYSDTGTYIASGLQEFVPNDRPMIYGLFIKLFSFNYSLWLVIAFQNLITAFVIYELLKVFNIGKSYFLYFYFSLLTFLVFFTGIGWYTNQVMPDFFAAISVLIIYILLKSNELSIYRKVILALLLLFSLSTHFSHLMLGLVMVSIIFLYKITTRKGSGIVDNRKLVSVFALILAGWFTNPVVNYIVEREFVLSKGTHIFLMAHLNDTGILSRFLGDKCDEEDYKDCRLCKYKDDLPVDLASFIYSSKIIDSTGGWDGSREEYNRIIRSTLKEPRYLFLNIYKSFTYGMIQLTHNRIGQGLSSYGPSSPPYGQIKWQFGKELNNYLTSRQIIFKGAGLNLKPANNASLVILVLSVFLLLFIFILPILRRIDGDTRNFLIFIVIAVVLNAFITAGLNAPNDRFQSRVVWMLPMALIILIAKNFSMIVSFLKMPGDYQR